MQLTIDRMNPNTASDHRIHAFQLNITEQRSFQWQELHSGDLEIRNTGDEVSYWKEKSTIQLIRDVRTQWNWRF